MRLRLKHRARVAVRLLEGLLSELEATPLGQYLGRRPVVLNLLVNDICNSRCSMCRIWQQKPRHELSPDELRSVLCDPLFARVRYAGVSGGEPTLRPDLPRLYDSILDSLPSLEGTGIITNAVAPSSVVSRIRESASRVLDRGKTFQAMVSIDGVGDAHDAQRGKPGNFRNALKVLQKLREIDGISLSVGCTVTRHNVDGVRRLKRWCEDNDVKARFRVAEFIKRLYNEEAGDVVRAFDEDQSYDLGLFFHELQQTAGLDPATRRTYGNVSSMLLDGAPRRIGCLWQSQGVTLDSAGSLLYCAPRSPKLGDAREQSSTHLFRSNLGKRAAILRNDCASCIHDYPALPRLREMLADHAVEARRKRLSLDVKVPAKSKKLRISGDQDEIHALPRDDILVSGWYGTETAGDKAILGAVLERLRREHPRARIRVSSLHPFITRRTLKELGFADVAIVEVYGDQFLDAAQQAGLVVIGGGPLMHVDELGVLLAAFRAARRGSAKTWILGCGIGPLDRGDRYQRAAAELLTLADRVDVRDQASQAIAMKLSDRSDIHVVEDPAVDFVRQWAANDSGIRTPGNYLNCYLREWPRDYARNLGAAFDGRRREAEEQLAELIRLLCEQGGLVPRFLPMHHFWIGGDDREFADRFVEEYLADLPSVVEVRPLSADELLSSMRDGVLNLCMRYHSLVFAHTLGTEFLALDYTLGGKVAAFAHERGCSQSVISFAELADGSWRARLLASNMKRART